MDITNIGAYTDMIASQNEAGQKIKQTVANTDYTQSSDEEMLNACKEFEAYFLEQVMKEMQKTVDCFKDENSTSNYSDSMLGFFKDETIQKIAKDSTESNSLGLAKSLYEQMKRNYDL